MCTLRFRWNPQGIGYDQSKSYSIYSSMQSSKDKAHSTAVLENLFVNIFCSITLDILYQLYLGVVKYLISWIQHAYGDAEIDACCHCLLPNHHIHLFLKEISHLSCVTGTEHDQICCFLLGIIINIHLLHGYSNAWLLRAIQRLLHQENALCLQDVLGLPRMH